MYLTAYGLKGCGGQQFLTSSHVFHANERCPPWLVTCSGKWMLKIPLLGARTNNNARRALCGRIPSKIREKAEWLHHTQWQAVWPLQWMLQSLEMLALAKLNFSLREKEWTIDRVTRWHTSWFRSQRPVRTYRLT